MFCIRIAEVESARECLDSGGVPEEEFELTLMVDGTVHAALRRFLDSISVDACRFPVHLLGLGQAMIGTLVAAGVPVTVLHATVADHTDEYYSRLDRAAKAWLPAPLFRAYKHIRAHTGARPVRIYRDGAAWGYSGPLIVLGRSPFQDEYYVSSAADDPDVLVLGKNPVWPGEYPDIPLNLQDEGTLERISVLTRGPSEWSAEPANAGAEWDQQWDAWADPDEE